MTEPTTAAAVPEATPGRVEEWIEKHIAPDIAELKADGAKAEKYLAAHAENLQNLSAVVVKVLALIKSIDPALAAEAAPVASEAEKVAADIAKIGAELLASAL